MPSPEAAAADTTAAYLTRRLCAEKGYSLETLPEAQALRDAADFILTKADGVGVQILCLVDREKDPARRFALSLDQVAAIGKACARYTGSINGVRMPVGIQIWEVGRGIALERERALSRRLAGADRTVVSTWVLDAASGRVTTTMPFRGLLAGRPYLERLLRQPRQEAAAPPLVATVEDGPPLVTYGLLGVLALVFAAEIALGIKPWSGLLAPHISTLIAMGGLLEELVQKGEWHRLFTAAFLHGDLIHLVLNGVALYMAGVVLEDLFGRAWLLALFVLGALGGSMLSYALNGPDVVSVGASGAIMALLAAAFTSSFRLPEGPPRAQIQTGLLRVLLPSLIPLVTHRSEGKIDFAAHLGGAVVGTLVGLFLMRTWPITQPRPRFQPAARVVALAGLLLFVGGFALVKKNFGGYVQAVDAAPYLELLIPASEINGTSEEEKMKRAPDFVARHPRDPRGHVFNAARLHNEGNVAAAVQELRRALEEGEVLRTVFADRQLEVEIRAYLSQLLVGEGKLGEAIETAAPVCHAGPGGSIPEELDKMGLCK